MIDIFCNVTIHYLSKEKKKCFVYDVSSNRDIIIKVK